MASGHSRFGPSSFYRWSKCPGSIGLSERVPPGPPNEYSKEGTRAHELLESLVKSSLWGPIETDAGLYSRGTLDAVTEALEYVEALDAPGVVIRTEHRVRIPTDAAPEDFWGTADIIVEDALQGTLEIIDYKHGTMVVEAEGNDQLMAYAAGVVLGSYVSASGESTVLSFQPTAVKLTIIQPRAFHRGGSVRSTTATFDEIWTWLLGADDAIGACLQENAPCNPGGWCRYCPAAGLSCEAQRAHAFAATGLTGVNLADIPTITLRDPTELTAESLGMVLEGAVPLREWLDACEAQAYEMARSGVTIPGRKLVSAKGLRAWRDDVATIAESLMSESGADLDGVMPRKIVGLTAAEALLTKAYKARGRPKGDVRAFMDGVTTKGCSGKLMLVSVSDKRPAQDSAIMAFASVGVPHIPVDKDQ